MPDLFKEITKTLNNCTAEILKHKEELRFKEIELTELRNRLARQRSMLDKEYWHWQSSDNFLDSLICPILITPRDLKALLEGDRRSLSNEGDIEWDFTQHDRYEIIERTINLLSGGSKTDCCIVDNKEERIDLMKISEDGTFVTLQRHDKIAKMVGNYDVMKRNFREHIKGLLTNDHSLTNTAGWL